MTNATAKSFLLSILQRDAADADPTADARTVAALVEREAATVRALREAEGLRHLVLVSVGDERLREVSRMPLWGEEAARAAEAEFVRAAAAADAVIAEPHRANPLAWRLHDKEGSDDVTGPIRWSGVTLRDAAWMGDFREGPVLHWRSNFRRELWSTPERLRRGPGVAVTTSPAGASNTGERIRLGGSVIRDEDGNEVVRLPRWTPEAATLRVDVKTDGTLAVTPVTVPAETDEATDPDVIRIEALVRAMRAFVASTGSEGVVIGLSGGIDSAVTAALAVEAFGAEKVTGIMLASRYTSDESRALVRTLTANLGLPYVERSIEGVHAAMAEGMEEDFGGITPGGIPDQNIQARIRGTWLMGVANAKNLIMLCNANKAECAMGYGTLYGDIAGGFAPIADLWKREVRDLAAALNRRAGREVIPEAIIRREPTAELRPGQRDRDSLPEYDLIEKVITEKAGRWAPDELATEDERRILRLFGIMRFKRRMSPTGPQMSPAPLAKYDARWPDGVQYPLK